MKVKVSLMEIVWLTVAAISLGFFVHALINMGWHKAYVFLIFVLLCLLMYWWRRSLRKSEENENKR